METLTKTQFKPILISTDKEGIANRLKSAHGIAEQLNQRLGNLEEFLGHDLKEKEKLDILKKGRGSFIKLLKKQFKFPNATDEFNLQALGKENEFESVSRTMSNVISLFVAYDFELIDGKVKLSEEGQLAIEKDCKTYTSNEKQNEIFKLATDLCENLNVMHSKSFLDVSNMYQIERPIKLIRLSKEPGQKKFIPDGRVISLYKSDGSMSNPY